MSRTYKASGPKRTSQAAKKTAADPGRPKVKRLGLRAYGRHRGVSLMAVQQAIAAGRITRGKDGKIDWRKADADWEQNTQPRGDGSKTETLADANRRRTLADAELKELDLAERRGELLPLDLFRERLELFVGRVNASIRGLRGRWAPHVIGIDSVAEAQLRLGPLINELLTELSESEPGADERKAAG